MDPDGQAHVFDCMPTKYKLSSASDRIFWINAKVSGSHIVFLTAGALLFSWSRKTQCFYIHLFAKNCNLMARSGHPNDPNKFAAKKNCHPGEGLQETIVFL